MPLARGHPVLPESRSRMHFGNRHGLDRRVLWLLGSLLFLRLRGALRWRRSRLEHWLRRGAFRIHVRLGRERLDQAGEFERRRPKALGHPGERHSWRKAGRSAASPTSILLIARRCPHQCYPHPHGWCLGEPKFSRARW